MLLADWVARLGSDAGFDFTQHGSGTKTFNIGDPRGLHLRADCVDAPPFLKFTSSDPGKQAAVDTLVNAAIERLRKNDLGGHVWVKPRRSALEDGRSLSSLVRRRHGPTYCFAGSCSCERTSSGASGQFVEPAGGNPKAMPKHRHLEILEQGVDTWNEWVRRRAETPDLRGANLAGRDLSGFDFKEADLKAANLEAANLRGASFTDAYLRRANLTRADLSGARMRAANCRHAVLRDAILVDGYLRRIDLSYVDLSGANLTGANLQYARFVDVTLDGATLKNCSIYGISVWNLGGTPKEQSNLIITPTGRDEDDAVSGSSLARDHVITVDDLEVAQFVNLLVNNDKIRNVIDTLGNKAVLILGRFTPERKAVLDAIRERLRAFNFVPMMFDFERPAPRDFTETIKTLAGLSRFIIADITNPRSSPLELQAVMPDYMIPFVPIIQDGEEPFPMFRDLQQKYGSWVLDVLRYDTAENLLAVLDCAVIEPAIELEQKLLVRKAADLRSRHVHQYLPRIDAVDRRS